MQQVTSSTNCPQCNNTLSGPFCTVCGYVPGPKQVVSGGGSDGEPLRLIDLPKVLIGGVLLAGVFFGGFWLFGVIKHGAILEQRERSKKQAIDEWVHEKVFDPKSFEIIRELDLPIDESQPDLREVILNYRSKNGFGAPIIEDGTHLWIKGDHVIKINTGENWDDRQMQKMY